MIDLKKVQIGELTNLPQKVKKQTPKKQEAKAPPKKAEKQKTVSLPVRQWENPMIKIPRKRSMPSSSLHGGCRSEKTAAVPQAENMPPLFPVRHLPPYPV